MNIHPNWSVLPIPQVHFRENSFPRPFHLSLIFSTFNIVFSTISRVQFVIKTKTQSYLCIFLPTFVDFYCFF
jgi:hypothetical protein